MAKQADIVFTLDTTASMGWVIEGMKQVILDLQSAFLENRIQVRVGLVEFRDSVHAMEVGSYPMDGADRRCFAMQHFQFEDQYFTSNANAFETAVNSLNALGGGPHPESSFDAICAAVEESNWLPSSHRVIIHITDAPPNIPDLKCQSADELVNIINENGGIDQLYIVCHSSDQVHYEPLAKSYQHMKEKDFIALEFKKIENDNTEDLIMQLRQITKTSSDNIEAAEVLLGRDASSADSTKPPSENPFDVDDEIVEEVIVLDHTPDVDGMVVEEDDEFMFDDD